jgi:hypothetical protein
MNRDELRRVIEEPARQAGVSIEPFLTERLLDSVKIDNGNLSILQFVLEQLWTKNRDHELTHSVYEDIGGIGNALAAYADDVLLEFSPIQQELVQRTFVQLVQPGRGTEDTRRRAPCVASLARRIGRSSNGLRTLGWL